MTVAGTSWRKWLVRAVGLVLMALILFKIGSRDLLAHLGKANWLFVSAAMLLCVLHFVVKAVRWNHILRQAGVRVGQRRTLGAYLAACLVGMVTPGRVGELSKALVVRQWDPSVSWGTSLGTVVLDRLLDILAFVLVAGWGVLRIGLPGDYRIAGEIAVLILLGTGFLAALSAWRYIMKTSAARQLKSFLRSRMGDSAGDFYSVLRQIARWPFLVTLGLTSLSYVLFYAFFFVLSRALGSGLSLGVLSWGISMASVASMAPISISGIGVRDFVLLAVFKSWGEPAGRVLALSLTYLGVLYLSLIVSGIWFFFGGGSSRQVTRIASESEETTSCKK